MEQGRRTPLDYLFFLRPVLLPPVWTIALLGTRPWPEAHTVPAWHWIIFLLHQSCLLGAVYVLNQICDIESDRYNQKLPFLTSEIISVNHARIFAILLTLLALGSALLFGRIYLLLTVVGALLSIRYSVGTRPWKNRPWLGLFVNALGHGAIVYMFGALFADRPMAEAVLAAVPYTLAVAAVFLATTIPDVVGDRKTGKITPVVAWGERTTAQVSLALVTLAVALAVVLSDRYLAFAGIAAFPFFLRSSFRPGESAATAAKAAVAALSIAAVIAYPIYLVLLLVGFAGTRLFFRWRFGLTYPTLT